MTWTVVVPVKRTTLAKTRLAPDLTAQQRVTLVRAMVHDTVAATLAAEQVGAVVVVTEDESVVADLVPEAGLGSARAVVRIVPEPSTGGLGAAVLAGIAVAREHAAVPVAVLLGDLPALTPAALDAALTQAGLTPLAVVTDADGQGTTLLTAGADVAVDPAFGPGSARAHVARGHVRLDAAPGLRQDVDVVDDLAAVAALGLGPATAAAFARLGLG